MPRANIEALSEGAGSKMIRKRKESNNDIYKIRAKMAISSKLQLKKTTTVHNLITFSIVFTNKNGRGRFNPPPSKQGVQNTQ